MNRKIRKTIISLGIILVFLLKTSLVLALEAHYPTVSIGGQSFSLNDTSSLGDFVCYLFGLGMSLAFFIAIIAVAFGGIYYLISYARGGFTTEAKEWIKAGISGLLLILCAYLILYTINPDLTKCQLAFLPQINSGLLNSTKGAPLSTSVNIRTYNEIPIGILVEEVLSAGARCYTYDQQGNPVWETIRPGEGKWAAPEDMPTCVMHEIEGAQKKSQVIAELASKIINLMEGCSCTDKETGLRRCGDTCGGQDGCPPISTCPNGSCPQGLCTKAPCVQPAGTNDCCPPGVKDKIEHGPINLSFEANGDNKNCPDQGCCTKSTTYNGLDEFRCPNPKDESIPCSGLGGKSGDKLGWVLDRVGGGEKVEWVINEERWNKLNLWQQLQFFKEEIETWKNLVLSSLSELERAKSALGNCHFAVSYIDFAKKYKNTNNKQALVLKKPETFNSLFGGPVDISIYCQEFSYGYSNCYTACNKMCPDSSFGAINSYSNCQDANCLKRAYDARSCPYGDGTFNNFQECVSSCQVSCLDVCKQVCADKKDPSGSCLSLCAQNDCKSTCSEDFLGCSYGYEFCENLKKYDSACISAPQNADKCLFNTENFANCANQSPDQGNADYCIKNAYKCQGGSNEYANYPDCVDPSGAQKCSDPTKPAPQNSVCYSSQNPNASCQDVCPETAKCPPASLCPDCPCGTISQKMKIAIPNKSYSGTATTCKDPSECLVGEDCINNVCLTNGSQAISCQEDPDCPSGKVCSAETCVPKSNMGKAGYFTLEQDIGAIGIVSTACPKRSGNIDLVSFNDDPLTFYCQDQWWTDPEREGLDSTPMGKGMVCPTNKEIPVGQIISDTESWVATFTKNIDKTNENIQKILDQMTEIKEKTDTKNSSNPAKDYCKCNAKLENGKPICTTDCQYNQQLITAPIYGPGSYESYEGTKTIYRDKTEPGYDINGNYYDGSGGYYDSNKNFYDGSGGYYDRNGLYNATGSNTNNTTNKESVQIGAKPLWRCVCAFVPCTGNPCQQVEDYLSQLWNRVRLFKLDFVDFYTYMLTEPRSNILKKLTYARKEINGCSLAVNNYGSNSRLLSCTRVEEEIIPPINTSSINFDNKIFNGYCYGKNLGDLVDQSLADNWFCCEEYIKNNN